MFEYHDTYEKCQQKMSLSNMLESSTNEVEIKSLIERDLPRTNFIYDEKNTEETFHEQLISRKGSYYQGDFVGSSLIAHVVVYQSSIIFAASDTKAYHTISFCYQNDEKSLCGFYLGFLDPNETKGTRPYCISLFENITASADQRQVHILSSDRYNQIPEEKEKYYFSSEEKKVLEPETISDKLKTSVKSEKIYQLLSPVFNQNGTINLEAFQKLKLRLNSSTGKNIDDGFERLKEKIEQFIKLYKQEPQNEVVLTQLANEISESYKASDYYRKYERFKKIYLDQLPDDDMTKNMLNLLQESLKSQDCYKQQAPDCYKQQAPNQNLISSPVVKNLIFASLACLACVAGILTLTGVFAPIGIALAGTLAVTLGIIGTSLTGLLSIGFTYKAHESRPPQTFQADKAHESRPPQTFQASWENLLSDEEFVSPKLR